MLNLTLIIKNFLNTLFSLRLAMQQTAQVGSRDVVRPIAATYHCHVAFHASKPKALFPL